MWLNEEAKHRGWSLREVARRGKVSSTAIINVANDTDRAGPKVCAALALAFDVPEERIWVLAGLMPDYGEVPPEVMSWGARLRELPESDRQGAMDLMERVLRVMEGRAGYDVQPRQDNAQE